MNHWPASGRRSGVGGPVAVVAAALLLLLLGQVAASPAARGRPRHWAQPLAIPGAPNLHRVSATLYRGAQPTAEGMRELKQMGIRTVVNLRAFHADDDELAGTGLEEEHIPFKTWRPQEQEVIRFLRVALDDRRTPVFVHCQHGADRTGLMCAVYRLVVDNCDKEEAIREMTAGGFGYHGVWLNLVRFLRGLDVPRLRRQLGRSREGRTPISPAPPGPENAQGERP